MPKISKPLHIEITPERFLNACSREELIEVDILITSPRFAQRMNGEDDLTAVINELETRKKEIE